MKKQIQYLFTAIFFFTRIPCPKWVNHSSEMIQKSTQYFSFIGIIVGSIAATIYYISSFIFPIEIAIFLSMISSIWVTGAFHEDGLADVCDGFGGGWTREKILIIMKDSRLGTFGVLGLFSVLLLKFFTLKELPTSTLMITIISGHSISRFTATILLFTLQYARENKDSKIKTAIQKISIKTLFISFFFGAIPLLLFHNIAVFLCFIPLGLIAWRMHFFYKKWIGGQTGDCVGALQQISEIVYYLFLIVLWKFI